MNAEFLLDNCLDRHLFLFSDCKPVEGHTASAIYDLARGQISTFPSAYYPFFALFRTHTLRQIVDTLAPDERDDFADFLEFLLAHEYITVIDDPTVFPELSSAWDMPCTIYEAIIDVREQQHDYRQIVEQLDRLGCQHLQVRAYSRLFGLTELAELARLCHTSSIQTIEAILAHDPSVRDEDYVTVVASNRVLSGLVVHSAGEERAIQVDFGAHGPSVRLVATQIQMTPKSLESSLGCGHISTRHFLAPSTPTFNELHHFNGCLNRKLSIDEFGSVRNCPAMATSFGSHRTVSLVDVVARADFRQAWLAKNDEIEVCRDCQYRYACTGCRALLDDPEAAHAKPLKCGYDPYTDTWSDWRERPNAMHTLRRYQDRLHLPVVPA